MAVVTRPRKYLRPSFFLLITPALALFMVVADVLREDKVKKYSTEYIVRLVRYCRRKQIYEFGIS